MAKYTLEEIMYGDKYGTESDVFVEVFRLAEQKVDPKTIREQLNTASSLYKLKTSKTYCICEIPLNSQGKS